MKKFATLYLIILLFSTSYAQKEDNMWVFGYHYYPSFLPALDFGLGYPQITASNCPIDFYGNISSICDTNGYIAFYTDGVVMMNYLHDTLKNGQHFNDDSLTIAQYGYMPQLISQNTFILPFPGHAGQYALIHHNIHPIDSFPSQPIMLSMSVVDMTLNNNEGEMILKNQNIINDTLLFGTLHTVRHANGRDWWITIHKWQSNIFYVALLSPTGVSDIQQISTGPYFAYGLYPTTQRVFSPTGEYFCIARADTAKVELFDFDRCTGNISFKEQIDFTSFSTTDFLSGCSFSASGRFLYVSDVKALYQFDMESSNIANSKKLIAYWDGSGGFNAYNFMGHQNGPDGKIYIAAPSSCNIVHVINYPDLLDTLCNFEQHSLTLLSNYTGRFPMFPNYRLGAVAGSICDSLGLSAINSMSLNFPIKLYPNPNNGIFSLEYTLGNNASGTVEITDAAGRLFYAKDLSKYSFIHQIDLSTIDEGIYFLKFLDGNTTKYQKFIVVSNN